MKKHILPLLLCAVLTVPVALSPASAAVADVPQRERRRC